MCPSSEQILKNEYFLRLNSVIDYIQDHYSEDLNLTKLASIACFSKFHFHRLFHAMIGETLNDFIQRIRLERSMYKLHVDLNKSITEIALECGFSSSQNFAKKFKTYFDITPSHIRTGHHWGKWIVRMKKLEKEGEKGLNHAAPIDYFCGKGNQPPIDDIMNKKTDIPIKITTLPDLRVSYIRTIGRYDKATIGPAFDKLMQWANPKELIEQGMFVLGVIQSDPGITPQDKLIYDACITIPESIRADKWINIQTLPGGKVAIHRCAIKSDHNDKAWMSLILNWLSTSDYQPDDRPLYEIHCNDSESHSTKHEIRDLCLPIKPLYE